ncbi:MAG: tRNA (adenosine(37)-N6)-dimethylallyltransferase MiaA [Ignavibacterium sp.]|mgnify:CR=1 FL=1|nr:tRNA (adenosine(37)-N6)-dimethylallyltransferase MiaA [Ignavibacterium sp.]MDX9712856.1 tRNA (adenosine(37)-N6)-dimethylallyltransferase MiaA [Ignavibacteriaceae bacterium]MEB2353761.1 tRNA (adenosine(37)-N6)-dimethylallyltransferase MiaA [Ignavibacteriales bacterium]GIK23307.1 MAG: tRNA dimethylallyltransferase [Ignavibacteriota bacterium]
MEIVIVIVGPTCSGKTKLSLKLAELLNSEIISADSRQIFKILDIGTAKPAKVELKRIKHHLINKINPEQDYNASKFAADANEIIKRLLEENKTPIVVGGSGLYIKALIDGIADSADTDFELREELLTLRKSKGNEYMYNELKKVDMVSAEKMLPQNWKRVIRAIEVFKLTGRPIWQHYQNQQAEREFSFNQIGLNWEREILYNNIETRVDKMINAGLVDEVKNILDMGYPRTLNALNTVGYKEIIKYLDNQITFDRAIELIKRNTRHYAKRQMTWFNADKRIKWYNINNESDLNNLAEEIAKEVNERKN